MIISQTKRIVSKSAIPNQTRNTARLAIKTLLLAVATAALISESAEPKTEIVAQAKNIFVAVFLFSLPFLLTCAVAAALLRKDIAEEAGTTFGVELFAYSAYRVALFAVLGALVIWLISNYGDDLYQVIESKPVDAISWTLSIGTALILAAYSGFFRRFPATEIYPGSGSAGTMTAMPAGYARPMTAQDVRRAAVHESGHAMLYSALNPIPVDLMLSIGKETANYGSLGFVRGSSHINLITTNECLEWELLTYLAGTAAESYLLKETSMGAFEDHRRWQARAIVYLTCSSEDVFIPYPENECDVLANRRILREFREKQLGQLNQFFAMNKDILKELSSRAGERLSLNFDELKPFLSPITFPEGFPRPCIDTRGPSRPGKEH